ncbi:MAG: response regulator [Rhodospirillales bacterium]|nr:response regulator [Rhodospirillales bacterium]
MTDDLPDKFKKLFASYASNLPGKHQALCRQIEKLKTASSGEDVFSVLEVLRDDAHKLSGGGGIYGYTNLSKKARALEGFCDGLFEKKAGISEEDLGRLVVLTDEVGDAIVNGPDETSSFLSSPQVAPVDRSPLRILVVDDDESSAYLAIFLLRKSGFVAEMELDPTLVEDRLAEFRPDLILMDMHMPGMNGIELAEKIRARDEFSAISIIFLSAEEDPELKKAALRAGGKDFLGKPYQVQELLKRITALDEARSGSG